MSNEFKMPDWGITSGSEQHPLYRGITLSGVNLEGMSHADVVNHLTQRINSTSAGVHWTHDKSFASEPFGYNLPDGDYTHVTLEAHHPGKAHTLSWDNPADKKTLHNTVIPEDSKDWANPEVPIRPGTPMTVTAVHVNGQRIPLHLRITA